jgi:hypothetical protein
MYYTVDDDDDDGDESPYGGMSTSTSTFGMVRPVVMRLIDDNDNENSECLSSIG